MKTIFTSFLIALSFFSNSQSIADGIGGVSCDFTILSYGNDLDIKKQLLFERAVAILKISDSENSSYGAGLGYTEWHLEFVAKKKVTFREREYGEDRNLRGKYEVQFIDKDKVVLSINYVSSDKLRLWKGGTTDDPMYTYSLNLAGLPFVLLDDVKFIEIILID